MSDNSRKSLFERLRSKMRKPRTEDKARDLAKKQVRSAAGNRTFPSWKQWKRLPGVLTRFERRVLQGALVVILLSVITIGGWYVVTHRVETPTVGGEYTEALIGEPQLINPLYASASDVDADLTQLVYSGLMRWDPQDGLVNDLASNIEISEDGTTYTVTIRDNAVFHNGDPVRARDVLFTINAIQNPLYRSNLASNFENVQAVQVDDRTVAFNLEEPFAPFPATLTVGIMPADIWGDIPPKNATLAALNLEPIGSGPYRFAEFSKDQRGTVQSYTLERNPDFYRDGPLIERLHFKFYTNANAAVRALDNRNVEGVSFVPTDLEAEVASDRSVQIYRPRMPRAIALFFNQENNAILEKQNIREVFAHTIDKQTLINRVLNGHGNVIHGPILPGTLGIVADQSQAPLDRSVANELLDEAGYPLPEGNTYRELPEDERPEPEPEEEDETTTQDVDDETDSTEIDSEAPETTDEGPPVSPDAEPYALTFTLTTVQDAEFVNTAEQIAEQMETVGVKIDLNIVSSDTFFNDTLPNRNYELLLTGTLSGRDPDPFPFWHSTQVREGGLNLALYENRNVDELLEEARTTTDPQKRAKLYAEFQTLLHDDIPAIFLYQSTYTYALPTKIKNVHLERISQPSDRFSSVNEWHIKTRKTLK